MVQGRWVIDVLASEGEGVIDIRLLRGFIIDEVEVEPLGERWIGEPD